jgi:serine protease
VVGGNDGGVDAGAPPGPDAGIPPIGSACTTDCGAGRLCVPESAPTQTGYVGGYCSALCNNGICPAGSSCVNDSIGGFSVSFCKANCATPGMGQGSCRAGYVCANGTGSAAQGVCTPRCTNAGYLCPNNTVCNAGSGYCQ